MTGEAVGRIVGDAMGADVVGETLGANVAVSLFPWAYSSKICECSRAEAKIMTLSISPVKCPFDPNLPSVPMTVG